MEKRKGALLESWTPREAGRGRAQARKDRQRREARFQSRNDEGGWAPWKWGPPPPSA